jgi:hypothetical protein
VVVQKLCLTAFEFETKALSRDLSIPAQNWRRRSSGNRGPGIQPIMIAGRGEACLNTLIVWAHPTQSDS